MDNGVRQLHHRTPFRLVGSQLLEQQQEEWQLERRRFFSEATMAKIPEPSASIPGCAEGSKFALLLRRSPPICSRLAKPRPPDTPASLSSDQALLETLARVGVQQPLCARPSRELGCEGMHPRHQH
jgi:hypothetical protein